MVVTTIWPPGLKIPPNSYKSLNLSCQKYQNPLKISQKVIKSRGIFAGTLKSQKSSYAKYIPRSTSASNCSKPA